jgi:hypothetical protein
MLEMHAERVACLHPNCPSFLNFMKIRFAVFESFHAHDGWTKRTGTPQDCLGCLKYRSRNVISPKGYRPWSWLLTEIKYPDLRTEEKFKSSSSRHLDIRSKLSPRDKTAYFRYTFTSQINADLKVNITRSLTTENNKYRRRRRNTEKDHILNPDGTQLKIN